ncbi:zwei Ig domain protein zig-2 [Patella vulgata]|uniref:zwei Ig domain protein zig-2 n=1 Tax=Patella vulgata TaxID=6465 RepID=UPI00217F91AF|nr:zwei Ig domain protein zig-2 [Patella vulgata]
MLRKILAVLLVLSYTSCFTSAFLRGLKHKYALQKRLNSGVSRKTEGTKLYFKGRPLSPLTRVNRHDNIILECEVGGTPTPTIHWLKNGERLSQGEYRDFHDDEAAYEDRVGRKGKPLLRLSSTKSKLYIDCLIPETEGTYSCIAETPFARIERSSKVVIDNEKYSSIESCLVKKSLEGESARIYLWTSARLEFEDATVQLYCRAEGKPQPKITWFDRNGKVITDGDEGYKVADNGDLIIKQISWMEHMGLWKCRAENANGVDTKETFLYPTARDEDDEFPL